MTLNYIRPLSLPQAQSRIWSWIYGRKYQSLTRHSMHLMVWIKDIYLGMDTEGDVQFSHLTLQYGF